MKNENKICSRCRLPMHITEFNICRGTIDGLQTYCRSCQSVAARDRRKALQRKWAGRDPYRGTK